MHTYRVWSRVTPLPDDRYLCVVVSIPDSDGDEARAESESRVLSSQHAARDASASMARAMADRIRARGDQVTAIISS